jgi:hypothetical protein
VPLTSIPDEDTARTHRPLDRNLSLITPSTPRPARLPDLGPATPRSAAPALAHALAWPALPRLSPLPSPLLPRPTDERVIDAQYASKTLYIANTDTSKKMFGVNFADGRIKGYDYGSTAVPNTKYYVLCVRGNTQYGVNSFKDNGDGTVTDAATGLMWQKVRAARRQSWSAVAVRRLGARCRQLPGPRRGCMLLGGMVSGSAARPPGPNFDLAPSPASPAPPAPYALAGGQRPRHELEGGAGVCRQNQQEGLCWPRRLAPA